MKLKIVFSLLSISLFFLGCGPHNSGISPWAKEKKVYGFSFMKAEIVESFGDKVIAKLIKRDIIVGDSYEDKLTEKIIRNSLFIPGLKTRIGRTAAVVTDVRGEEVTLEVKDEVFVSGQEVKIYLPKKTIAVMDFSLRGVENSEVNKFAMEDMTTKLVQSGQYIVVEREKLDTILKEQKLADSGLMDERTATKLGRLVSADIILTGSFVKYGANWKVNLRLVDVETGIILSAISDKISIDDFRPKQKKESSNITEDFEDEVLSKGWNLILKNRAGAQSSIGIDKNTGAKGTKNSLKISYKLKKEKSITRFENQMNRDISGFWGIKFYAKSDKYTTIMLEINDQNYDDNHMNKWVYLKSVNGDNKWREYKVPFESFNFAKNFARKNPGGDGVFDRDAVSDVRFSLRGADNQIKEDRTLWLDEISFY